MSAKKAAPNRAPRRRRPRAKAEPRLSQIGPDPNLIGYLEGGSEQRSFWRAFFNLPPRRRKH